MLFLCLKFVVGRNTGRNCILKLSKRIADSAPTSILYKSPDFRESAMKGQKTQTENHEDETSFSKMLAERKGKSMRPTGEPPPLNLNANGIGPCYPLAGLSEEDLETWRNRTK